MSDEPGDATGVSLLVRARRLLHSTRKSERFGDPAARRQRRLVRNARLLMAIAALDRVPGTRGIKTRMEHALIVDRGRALFDADYYVQMNPDVAHYPGGPLQHFCHHGWRENRNPHPLFDLAYYRAHGGPRRLKVNPLVHFLLVGQRRRISPTRWFSYDFYEQRNSDVRVARIDPFIHYLRYGILENRAACDEFDSAHYVSSYPDVAEAGVAPLLHYLRYGLDEGRVARPVQMSDDDVPDMKANEEARRGALKRILAMQRLAPTGADDASTVDIVIPVYRNFHLTMACILHALRARGKTPFEIVVVDDCTPEPEIAAALDQIAERGLVTLLRHERNRGFVVSVNDGIRLHANRDVVLLNSDAEVQGDWLDRMQRAAYADPDIATVSPLTNSGTICSYPRFVRDNSVPADANAQTLDAIAADVNAKQAVEAPTGVGFCLYVRRAALDDVGLLDETAFGTGYGEENDFCLRARAAGWRDVIATDVFVHHLGSASFLGEKGARVANALSVIQKRYPDYERDVHTYIKRDPLRLHRARIDAERLKRLKRDRNILIVSHARGGGTEQHIQERTQRLEAEGWSVFRMEAALNSRRHARLFHGRAHSVPNLDTYFLGSVDGRRDLIDMLRRLGIGEIEIHHLVDFWVGAPEAFSALAAEMSVPLRFTVHDYTAICPRVNLVDLGGMYCGEPPPQGCRACLRERGSDFGAPDIDAWRAEYANLLASAENVTVPDADVRDRLRRHFPDLAYNIAPHEPPIEKVSRRLARQPGNDRTLRVGTIGAISPIKGLNILRDCARHAKRKRLPLQFVVVGYTSDDVESAKAGLEITGAYHNARVLEAIENARLDAILLPSLWPETYSYTLSAALRSGIPIIAFDIGAIARRLRERDEGTLLELSLARRSGALTKRIYSIVGTKATTVRTK